MGLLLNSKINSEKITINTLEETNNELLKENGDMRYDRSCEDNKLGIPSNESICTANLFKETKEIDINFNFITKQLEEILKNVSSKQELFNDEDLPVFNLLRLLQNKLEAILNELETIICQIKAAAKNNETMKLQNKAILKERKEMNRLLQVKIDEEKEEMEKIVFTHDNPMYQRWDQVKDSPSRVLTKIFLLDVKDKLQAMSYLQIIASEKLYRMKNSHLFEKDIVNRNNEKNIEKKFKIVETPTSKKSYESWEDWDLDSIATSSNIRSRSQSHNTSETYDEIILQLVLEDSMQGVPTY
uniref:Uncharacterized protein n=1 Tax=Clastoptera arizonana TaxID=38151 RepID=A0A1B6DIN8_9HEMI